MVMRTCVVMLLCLTFAMPLHAQEQVRIRRRSEELFRAGTVLTVVGSVFLLTSVWRDSETTQARDARRRELWVGAVFTGAGAAMAIAGGLEVQVSPSRAAVQWRWSLPRPR